jgi:protein-L-isoaspartate O-methyltransferase
VAVEEQEEVRIGLLAVPRQRFAPEGYLESQFQKFLQPHIEPQSHHQVVPQGLLSEFLEVGENLSLLSW